MNSFTPRQHEIVRAAFTIVRAKGIKGLTTKELAKADADIARVDAKLGNADFLARAPEEVVDGEREKREEAVARRAKLADALDRLKGAEA